MIPALAGGFQTVRWSATEQDWEIESPQAIAVALATDGPLCSRQLAKNDRRILGLPHFPDAGHRGMRSGAGGPDAGVQHRHGGALEELPNP